MRLARDGVRFDRAFATAPITLTSHASLMTGRYPPGHGARHNGMRIDLEDADAGRAFARAGFATAAFVAAFPLDRRFGLIKGFQTYGDAMPRDAGGRVDQRASRTRRRGRGARVGRPAPQGSGSSSGSTSSSRTRHMETRRPRRGDNDRR